jgi:hypothetical protein
MLSGAQVLQVFSKPWGRSMKFKLSVSSVSQRSLPLTPARA